MQTVLSREHLHSIRSCPVRWIGGSRDRLPAFSLGITDPLKPKLNKGFDRQMNEETLERMKVEFSELASKMNGLANFLGSDSYLLLTNVQQKLLTSQLQAMLTYSNILNLRIETNNK